MGMRIRLAALLLGLGAVLQAHAGCSRSMRAFPEHWPPYTIIEGRKFSGLDIDLVEAIFKEAGCQVLFEPEVPVARRLSLFEQGKADLMMAASITPERQRSAWFSQPYRFEEVSVFTLPEHAARLKASFSFEALLAQQAPLLVPKHGYYGPQYEAAEPKLRAAGLIREFTTFSQALKMLAAGRAVVLMGDDAAIHYQARLENLPVVHLSFTAARDPVHFMFNRKTVSADDVDAINGAIGRLEKNGVLKAIRKRYGQQ